MQRRGIQQTMLIAWSQGVMCKRRAAYGSQAENNQGELAQPNVMQRSGTQVPFSMVGTQVPFSMVGTQVPFSMVGTQVPFSGTQVPFSMVGLGRRPQGV